MSDSYDDPADDPRVLAAAREYLAGLEAGRPVDRSGYVARYPDLAAALEECFDGIDLAHAAGVGLRADADPAPAVRIGPDRQPVEPLGDFKIVREIGRGGMGVVYEAVQLSLGRRVALKVLPFAAGLDAKQLQRFKTEAHAAAQLHHTNIVPVYAVGCERGVHFYAMQLIDGRPLDAVIRELRGADGDRGPDREPSGSTVEFRAASTVKAPPADRPGTGALTRTTRGRDAVRTAARFAAQVADALAYAHDAGVVHRDVKPANLLLDGRGTVWVADFGLAQVTADPGVTRTGDVFGTLRYMSPEQATGRRVDVDHRTDVYSLGATLYELLTLEPIFPGQDRPALLHQILNEEPTPPRRVDRTIPVDLETIVLKAVAKSPADRYATAGDMAADLRRFLDALPIHARRPSLADRTRKWLRRHPGSVGVAVVLMAVGVVGLAVATALVAREEQRTRDAYQLVVEEQGKTRAALDRERQRAEEAEQRFLLAKRSADEMIRIADEELADNFGGPGGQVQQTLRRRLLEAALAYYQEFIDQRRDDPGAQAELEATRDRVRTILADLAVLQGAWQHVLLTTPEVQIDLSLSAEQRGQIGRALSGIGWPKGDHPWDGRGPKGDRGRPPLDELRAHQKAIEAVLSPPQLNRLRQIAFQLRGWEALRDPDVVAALRLTPEQRERLRWTDGPPRFGGPDGLFRSGPKKGGGRGPKGGGDEFLAVLTPEQRARWKELTGRPYDGPRPFGGPGGGGPGGRGPHDGPPFDDPGPPPDDRRPDR